MGHAQSGGELCSSRNSNLPESTCGRLPVNDIPRLDCCKASSSRSRPVPEVVVLVPQPERRGISAGQLADFFLSFCGEIVFAREPEDKPLCLPTKLAVLCAEKNQRNAALSLRANGKSYVSDLYAVKELLILPQTRRELVSYAEKLNPEGLEIEYYISHHWAEDFAEFVQGILRHAIWAVQGTRRDWRQVSYWCCAFSNNQHDARLGANLTESSFHKALRSERCIGMVLNLNRAATALFRVWCLYEMFLAHQLKKQFVINSHTGPLVVGSSSDEEHDAWVLLLLRLLHHVDVRCAAATSVTDQDLILREIERHQRDDGLFGIDVLNGVAKSLVAGQAIFLLARRGHLEGVELAVSLGASASSIDTRGVCPFTYAVACGHTAIAEFLQGKGARQHAEKGAANVVAMWSECAKQRGDAIRIVEQLCHDDSQVREIHGKALEKAKVEHYSAHVFELVSYLCSSSAELRLKALKELLDSPSMREVSDILSKVACLLLDSDARVRQAAVDAIGKVDIAKSEVLPGSFTIAAQNLCAVDTQGRNIFHVAARSACANALHILNIAIDWPSSVELVSKALAARDVWHRTPAHNAVEVDSSEALRVLVKFGAVLELPAGPSKVQEGAVVVVRHDKGPALARICSVSADGTKIKVEYEAACQPFRFHEEWVSLDRCVLAPTPLELAQELGRMKAEAELQIQLGASNTTRKTSIKVQQGLASRSASRGVQELDQEKLKHFKEMLWEREGIDTSTWGTGTAKSVEALFWEVFVQRGCIIMGGWSAGQLKRVVRLVKVPLKKLIWTKSSDDGWNAWDEQVYIQDCPFCEDWRTACREVLQSHLGLSQEWQNSQARAAVRRARALDTPPRQAVSHAEDSDVDEDAPEQEKELKAMRYIAFFFFVGFLSVLVVFLSPAFFLSKKTGEGKKSGGGMSGQNTGGGMSAQNTGGGMFGQNSGGGTFSGQTTGGGLFDQPAGGGMSGQQQSSGKNTGGGMSAQNTGRGMSAQNTGGGMLGQNTGGGMSGQNTGGGMSRQNTGGGTFSGQTTGGGMSGQNTGGANEKASKLLQRIQEAYDVWAGAAYQTSPK